MESTLISALRLRNADGHLTWLEWAKYLLLDLDPCLEIGENVSAKVTSFTHFKLKLHLCTFYILGLNSELFAGS